MKKILESWASWPVTDSKKARLVTGFLLRKGIESYYDGCWVYHLGPIPERLRKSIETITKSMK